MKIEEKDCRPEGRENHWLHEPTGHVLVGRPSMTLQELLAEINSAEI